MSKIIYLCFYMILVPLALGCIWNVIFLDKVRVKRLIEEVLVRIYSVGLLLEFALWEMLYQVLQRIDATYDILMNNMLTTWRVCSIAFAFVAIILVILKRDSVRKGICILSDGSSEKKRRLYRNLFVVFYIIAAVLFVHPSQLDNTVNQMVDIMEFQIIASHHEFIYVMLASLCGIGVLPFTHYILNGSLLLFFFGIYSYIEQILFKYNSRLQKVRTLMECMFAVYLVLLLFIRGSLYIAVPQNIWNSSTMLASVILPFAFVYGYAFLMERKGIWLFKMVGMMLVVDLFYAKGYLFVGLLLFSAIIMYAVDKVLTSNVFQKKVKDED